MSTTLETLFRPTQYEILSYQRGKVGVSAVPGSGKTFTLSHLAANLIKKLAERKDADQVEVLIVTFTNVAVNSFKRRLYDILQQRRMILPYVGYRVRTLHGLAHDILRERPSLVGLADDFQIVDERAAAALRADVVQSWLREHGTLLVDTYLDESITGSKRQPILDDKLPELATRIANRFIRHAKDLEFSPAALRAELDTSAFELPLARFGIEVYEAYQHSLTTRGAVDFDDLARLALQAIRSDAGFGRRLQQRWPYILEDEAQDSSQLQQTMLKLLSGDKNWVRVGDPNQAINTTFTTANPDFLNHFLDDPQVKTFELYEAGRSAQPILELANHLVTWTAKKHPASELHEALSEQMIRATPPGDLQPNPSAEGALIHIQYKPGVTVSSEEELKFIASSLERWLPDHPDQTVAVLVPENERGFRLVELLRERGLAYEELLSSTTTTRAAAELLRSVLGYLAAPLSNKFITLARLYEKVWWPLHLERLDGSDEWCQQAMAVLSAYPHAESFLWPDAGEDTPPLEDQTLPPELQNDLAAFRRQARRWLEATILPIDQLVLTVNQDLFTNPSDIALGYKLASLLRGAAHRNPTWRLPEFVEELRVISQNERKFLGFEGAEIGYKPLPGQITVSTIHQAKGLEWDRVYLSGVSNYVFPSLQPYDTYIGETWYIRDRLNLEAEILAQLNALHDQKAYHEGEATVQARADYAAEHLRLLYVGITRARRELCMTWNTGRFAQKSDQFKNGPALPLVALWEHMQGSKS